MKLYATTTKSNGKTEGLGDNDDLVVNFYYKNKVVYMVRLSYCNVGDLEKPSMDLIITSRDYRGEGKKQKGDTWQDIQLNDDVKDYLSRACKKLPY